MSSRIFYIPMSVRRRVADAITAAEPIGTTPDWARAEAAIDALAPHLTYQLEQAWAEGYQAGGIDYADVDFGGTPNPYTKENQ